MKKGLFFFVFCLLCEEVFAGVFSVIPTDKSQEYLGIIFGGSVGAINLSGDNNPTLSLMFERFNFIIVTIGAVVLSYIGLMTTINTAREGEAMGKKMSIWVPLRAFSGMLLMVPGPGSGYSVVQMTVMWIVLNGIGAANSVWEVVLEQLAQGVPSAGDMGIPLKPNNLEGLTLSVLQARTCMEVINTRMPSLLENAGPLMGQQISIYTSRKARPAASPQPLTEISVTATTYVGVEGGTAPYNSLCGSFFLKSTILSADKLNAFNYETAAQRLEIKIRALESMFEAVAPIAEISAATPNLINDNLADPGYISKAGQAYITNVSEMATGINAPLTNNAESWEKPPHLIGPLSTNYAKLKSYGWIHAGSYYFTMVKAATTQLDDEVKPLIFIPPNPSGVPTQTILDNGKPTTSDWQTVNAQGKSPLLQILSHESTGNGPPQTVIMNTALSNSFNYAVKDSGQKPASQGLVVKPSQTGNNFLDKIVNGLRDGMQTPILEYVQKIAEGSSEEGETKDPLISISQFGGILMLAGEISVFISIISGFVISLVTSAASCVSPVAWGVNFLLTSVLPMLYALAIAMWTLGATLGIYLPLVPYLIFTMTAFGWMIQVIEAVVAAPIIALGLVQPGGEELGKIGASLPILANIFLRPTLMIFGFVLGASLLRAGIALVNFGFIPAISEGATVSIFSIIPVLGLYIAMISSVVNKSFSLIYVLPNQIMRWMGGSAEGGDPSDMVKEAKGGFDGGAGQAQQGMQAGSSKANEKAASSIETLRKEAPAKEKAADEAHQAKKQEAAEAKQAKEPIIGPTRPRRGANN